jgi:hypothetical protein
MVPSPGEIPLLQREMEAMAEHKAISKLLRLKGLRVTASSFKAGEASLILYVKPYKNGCRCSECGRRCTIKRAARKCRKWRDVAVCGWAVYFAYAPNQGRRVSDPRQGAGGDPVGRTARPGHIPA